MKMKSGVNRRRRRRKKERKSKGRMNLDRYTLDDRCKENDNKLNIRERPYIGNLR